MWFGTLLLVVALAAGATVFWALYEKRVIVMSLLGGVLWLYAGWHAHTIEQGTTVVIQHSTPMLQYVFYFLALVNLVLLLFWVWSEPEDRQDLLEQL